MDFKSVIFDLDQTLVDSSALENLRNNRQWAKALRSLDLIRSDTKLIELLNNLSNRGLKIGVVTNSPGHYAEAVLSHFSIPYDSLVAYHDVSRRKPDPEAFLKTLSKFNLTYDCAISVGDHDNDILASKRANICSVGVKWFSPDYEFTIQPNYIYTKTDELITLLKL